MKSRGIHAYYFLSFFGYFEIAKVNRVRVIAIPIKLASICESGVNEKRMVNRVAHVIANADVRHI